MTKASKEKGARSKRLGADELLDSPLPPSQKQRPLKILMIAPTSFFSDYGGHIRILEETLALQKLGHKVTIVTYYKGRDLTNIDIRRTLPVPYRTDYEVGSSRHKVAFDVLLSMKALSVAVKERPDVIHGHMHEGALIGAVLAKLLRVPLVFDFQGSLSGEMIDHGFIDPQGSIYPKLLQLERWISHRPNAILTSSVRAKALLHEQFGVPLSKLEPLPDCVDMRRFDPALFSAETKAALRQSFNIPSDHTIIAYLGLLADYQGTDHLIKAAARLKAVGKNAHFLIMGYPNEGIYRSLAEQLDVSDCVTLTGKIPYDEAPLYLSLGDIAVSAKMSSTEGSGKVLNYMAMGQPIVAYDSQVHREYLGDLGVFPPSGDIEAFSAELSTLLDNPQRRRELGTALRERARQRYSWDAAAQKIAALYQTLLTKTAAAV